MYGKLSLSTILECDKNFTFTDELIRSVVHEKFEGFPRDENLFYDFTNSICFPRNSSCFKTNKRKTIQFINSLHSEFKPSKKEEEKLLTCKIRHQEIFIDFHLPHIFFIHIRSVPIVV